MLIVVTSLNSLIARLLWALLGPLRLWPPLAGLTVVSLLVAIALLVAFKYTSNQRALADTKRQMLASLFELRLFQDDPRLMLRVIAGLLRQQARYLGYACVPVLVASLPITLLLPHLHAYYGYASLRPGDSTVVIVRLKPDAPSLSRRGVSSAAPDPPHPCDHFALEASPGLHVDTPCVWASSLREGAWRISIERDGDFTIAVRPTSAAAPRLSEPPATMSGRTAAATMPVRVTEAIVARSPMRTAAASWWDAWLAPAAPPLPADAPFEALTVRHPARAIDVVGYAVPWLVVFFVLTTLFMLLGRRLFRVVF